MAQLIKIIYTPEGGSRREWEVDLANPAWDVHKMAPKAAGLRGWAPFAEALEGVDADAWQALVWVLRKRTEPQLRFDSVTFPNGLLAEIDFAGQCPSCKEWVGTDDDTDGDHNCTTPDPDVEDGQESSEGEEPGEA
ncbi:hypothetical protein ACIRN4_16380 [Pimelobacter simplex]|uniref:hypothetical protein n=1 Tax=Nocardioides simplex TaxID=2045 RepID=UPI003827D11C